jgi:hypothetical protein
MSRYGDARIQDAAGGKGALEVPMAFEEKN